MMNKDSKFKQILSSQRYEEGSSQHRISSSTYFPNEQSKQKSSHSSTNLMITQQRPFTAKVGSQKSLTKLPDSKQLIPQQQQMNSSRSSQSNPFLKHRNVSSPHQQQKSVKIVTNNNVSHQQIPSTQSGLTFKSLENIPQSSQNIHSNQQITNQSFKGFTPLKTNQQLQQSYGQQQRQNYSINIQNQFKPDELSQISDSYLMQQEELDDMQQDMSFHIQQALNTIKVEQVIKLYESKCSDIKLDVSFPQLIKFVDRVQKSCQDGKLDLSEQSLGPNSAKIVAEIVANNPNFSSINLNRNNIKDEGALVIAQAIMNNPNICVVNIANNNLSIQGCQYFFELLQASETVYALNISSPESYNRNKMNQQTAKAIQQMLKSNTTLSFLDISHSQLGPQGLHKIVKGLKENKGVISINLSYNDFGQDCGMLLQPILLNNKLIELNLSNNKIGNQSLEKIGEVIRSGQGVFSIERLDFSYNQITSDGFCDFMNTIMRNNKVLYLNFDGNSFQDQLNDSLTNYFIANNSLKSFSVRDCSFHASFVENISLGLQQNEALQVLDISHNYIGDLGVQYLAEALCKENQSLEELYMKRCNIQEKGGAELAKIIAIHPRLRKLDVSHNLMSEDSGTYIATNIRSNWNIVFFDIDKNYIRYDQHMEIKKLIKRNQEFQKMKEPVKLLNTLSTLRSQEVRKEDLDKRKNDLIYKEHLNKQEGQLLTVSIQNAEVVLHQTEEVVKQAHAEIKSDMEVIMRELKDQDILQNTQIQDLQQDIDKQFENNQNSRKEIEQMRKEIKQKTQEMIQRKNLLLQQVAFQKRIVKDEELKAKSEEMAYQMFLSNVESLKKKIELLNQGKLSDQQLQFQRTLSTPGSPQTKQGNFSFPSGNDANSKSSAFKKNKTKAASSTNLKSKKVKKN